jgi:hypothetical protein
MADDLIVTMFQVFLVLTTVVLCVAGSLVVKALWRRWVIRALTGSVRAVCKEKACTQGQQPPGAA